jgi:hypothetical protein
MGLTITKPTAGLVSCKYGNLLLRLPIPFKSRVIQDTLNDRKSRLITNTNPKALPTLPILAISPTTHLSFQAYAFHNSHKSWICAQAVIERIAFHHQRVGVTLLACFL